MKIFLVILSILLWISSAQATTWYVDSSVGSSGNGQSWGTAWKAFSNITGLSAGDTVYISGGVSGQSYSVSNWTPTRGTSGNPITYAVGQDTGHTGMVAFTGTGNFLQGNLSGITINGEVSGNRRMTISSSYNWTVYSDGADTNGFKLLYVEFTSPIWGRGTGYEIAYCQGISPLSMLDDSYIAHIGDNMSGGHTANSIHHNYFQVWRKKTAGEGQDCLKWVANVSIYNNTIISVYNVGYTGTQHGDGIQAGQNDVWLYNNYFENFISYPVYCEMYGNVSGWRIFNNVIYANESGVDWSAYQCMAIGFSSTGTVSDYIVANNTCIGGSNRRGIHFNTGVPGTVGSGCYIVNNLVYNSDTTILYNGNPSVSNNIGGSSGIAFENNTTYPNGSFRLTASATAAIDRGINPSYLISVYSTDRDGVTRPQGSAWDIGAYEYASGSGSTTIIGNGASAGGGAVIGSN